jgi:WD40 repeat protein
VLGSREGAQITALAVHPRDAVAAAGYADGLIMLTDIGGRRDRVLAQAQDAAITTLAWSKDARHLAAGTESGQAMLYDFQSLSLNRP